MTLAFLFFYFLIEFQLNCPAYMLKMISNAMADYSVKDGVMVVD